MGVTIHYKGKLINAAAYDSLIETAKQYALLKEWLTETIENREVKLLRVDDMEQDSDYTGPTQGVTLYPHEDCEPTRLEFDRDFYIQEYTKTQFAGTLVHIQVVEFLRKIEPHFDCLAVEDEGEFWDTQDEGILASHIASVNSVIEEYRRKDPRNEIKVKTPDGRIVDLINYDQEQSGS